ncbi:endonuclease [Mycoplasmopsis iners]|uniref:endonuclease n=1 Tax=Mycoplasmopsis iners TaxID=76630 RepID=UPI00068E3A87|nr:endonuclease [Mycoplasmopsis iners]
MKISKLVKKVQLLSALSVVSLPIVLSAACQNDKKEVTPTPQPDPTPQPVPNPGNGSGNGETVTPTNPNQPVNDNPSTSNPSNGNSEGETVTPTNPNQPVNDNPSTPNTGSEGGDAENNPSVSPNPVVNPAVDSANLTANFDINANLDKTNLRQAIETNASATKKPYTFIYDRQTGKISIVQGKINWAEKENWPLIATIKTSYINYNDQNAKQLVHSDEPTYISRGKTKLSNKLKVELTGNIAKFYFKTALFNPQGNHTIDSKTCYFEVNLETSPATDVENNQPSADNSNVSNTGSGNESSETAGENNVITTNDTEAMTAFQNGKVNVTSSFSKGQNFNVEKIRNAIERNEATEGKKKPFTFGYDRNSKTILLSEGNWSWSNASSYDKLVVASDSFIGNKQLANATKPTYTSNGKTKLSSFLEAKIIDNYLYIVFKKAVYQQNGNHIVDNEVNYVKINLNSPDETFDGSTSTSTNTTEDNPTVNNDSSSTDSSSSSITLTNSNVNYIYDANNNYYAAAEGKRGAELWEALLKIQKSKTQQIGSYADLYKIYRYSDIDKFYENDGTILDIYSENPNGSDPYNFKPNQYEGTGGSSTGNNLNGGEASTFNREHMIPQSWFSKVDPTRNDPHFILPTDKYVNNRRGNLPHFTVNNPTWTSLNGTKVDGTHAEPIDIFKGNTARMYFYFQITHKNAKSGSGPRVFQDAYPYFNDQYLTTYKNWANADQVDIVEVTRNNAIAKYYEDNNRAATGMGMRNPFIDYPNLPELIWGSGTEVFHNQGILVNVEPAQ